jgi:hypothetical protein
MRKSLPLTIITVWLLAVLGPTAARAACPDTLCQCLGTAKNYTAVSATNLTVAFGKISASGYSYKVETDVEGTVCGAGPTTLLGSAEEAPTVLSDVVGKLTIENAIKVKGVKSYGVLDPGVEVNGDLVTGGGAIVNPQLAIVDGAIDTTGTHPLVGDCTNAQNDVAQTATTFDGLTATQTLPAVVAKGGEEGPFVITTAPGLNVIDAESIKVAPKGVSGYPEGSELTIDMDAAATLVVIRTPKLSIGKLCLVSLTGAGANPERAIFYVNSMKSAKVSQEAVVEPAILAPLSTVTVLGGAEASNVYGRKVTIKGAQMTSAFVCSPSGAFLDGGAPLF